MPNYLVYGKGGVRHIAAEWSMRATLCQMFYKTDNLDVVRDGDERIILPLCRSCMRSPRGRLLTMEEVS